MNYELCEHGKRIGLDDCETCSVVGLKSQLRRMLEERNEARSKLDVAVSALRRHGYRESCDVPACNCGDQWSHGGHAAERLRELADVLYENGKTPLQAAKGLVDRLDALNLALTDEMESREHYQEEAYELNRKVEGLRDLFNHRADLLPCHEQRCKRPLGHAGEHWYSAQEIVGIESKLDAYRHNMGVAEAQIKDLKSRLDSIRAIVLPAAVSSNSRDHVSAICELYKLFGEVVERHEPVMGFPAESEAEELRRKNSFFPPLMPKSE